MKGCASSRPLVRDKYCNEVHYTNPKDLILLKEGKTKENGVMQTVVYYFALPFSQPEYFNYS